MYNFIDASPSAVEHVVHNCRLCSLTHYCYHLLEYNLDDVATYRDFATYSRQMLHQFHEFQHQQQHHHHYSFIHDQRDYNCYY